MKLCGICLLTSDAPRLAAFYQAVFQQVPDVDESHYSFGCAQLSVYDPGDVAVSSEKSASLMYFVEDLMAEYARLMREIPDIDITSPPQRRPWGACSMWFRDPDGHTVSFIQQDTDRGDEA